MRYDCEYSGIDVGATGARIRQLIEINKLSIKHISNTIGVSNQCVYKWINGHALPSLENLYQLSIILGVRMDDIVVGTSRISYALPELYVRDSMNTLA